MYVCIAARPNDTVPDVPRPGKLINIAHRDPRLPRLYQVKTHVKVKAEWRAKRIFIYLQDTSPQAMEDYYKYVSKMPFPEGTPNGIRKAGTPLSSVL